MIVSQNKIKMECVTVKIKSGKTAETVYFYGAAVADILKSLLEKHDGQFNNWIPGSETKNSFPDINEKPKRKRRTKAQISADETKDAV